MPESELEKRMHENEKKWIKLEQWVRGAFTSIQDSIRDVKNDVNTLKQHDEEFSRAVYDSCDAKTKEIDEKVEKAVTKSDEIFSKRINVMAEVFDKRIKAMFWGLGTLAGIFIGSFAGTIIYFNNADGVIHEKINVVKDDFNTRLNTVNHPVIENRTDIKRILHTLDKMDGKLDGIVKHTHKR